VIGVRVEGLTANLVETSSNKAEYLGRMSILVTFPFESNFVYSVG